MVTLINWGIIRTLGPGHDPVKLCADFLGHPTVTSGTPGVFVEFDRVNGTAVSASQRHYRFELTSFQPTGFAQTVTEAFDWIEANACRIAK